jgi:hypothetical protein
MEQEDFSLPICRTIHSKFSHGFPASFSADFLSCGKEPKFMKQRCFNRGIEMREFFGGIDRVYILCRKITAYKSMTSTA